MKNSFPETEILLKNGEKVTIRQAQKSDAEQLIKTVKHYVKESTFIPMLESEFTLTIEQEEAWIQSFIDFENSLLLLAIHNNQIIGNIDVTGSRRKIMQHTAVIGMGMLPQWQNCGLGTALMSLVINWAKANSLLEILWLQVYTANNLGLNLYKKVGFKEVGIISGFFKQDNTYYDNLTMVLSVKE